MKLFKNMHHLKQKSHQTYKPARFLQNNCLHALKLPLINNHAKTTHTMSAIITQLQRINP